MGRLESENNKDAKQWAVLVLITICITLMSLSSLQEDSHDPLATQPVNKSQGTTVICNSPHPVANTAEALIEARYPYAFSLWGNKSLLNLFSNFLDKQAALMEQMKILQL